MMAGSFDSWIRGDQQMSHSKQAVHAAVSAVALSLGIVGSTALVRADEAAPAAPDAQGAAVPHAVAAGFPTSGRI